MHIAASHRASAAIQLSIRHQLVGRAAANTADTKPPNLSTQAAPSSNAPAVDTVTVKGELLHSHKVEGDHHHKPKHGDDDKFNRERLDHPKHGHNDKIKGERHHRPEHGDDDKVKDKRHHKPEHGDDDKIKGEHHHKPKHGHDDKIKGKHHHKPKHGHDDKIKGERLDKPEHEHDDKVKGKHKSHGAHLHIRFNERLAGVGVHINFHKKLGEGTVESLVGAVRQQIDRLLTSPELDDTARKSVDNLLAGFESAVSTAVGVSSAGVDTSEKYSASIEAAFASFTADLQELFDGGRPEPAPPRSPEDAPEYDVADKTSLMAYAALQYAGTSVIDTIA